MLSSKDYLEHREVIRGVAKRVLRRVHAAGARTVQLEDIIGELNIAWVVAKRSFDPVQNPGVPFVAYLRRGMFLHINRWVAEELKEFKIAPFELDRSHSDDADTAETTANRLSFDAATQVPGADDILIAKEQRERFYARLSPLTRKFVEILEHPPIELLQEVEALQARSAFARSRGINSAAPRTVSPSLVFDFMGYTRAERNQVYEDIRFATERVSQ